jgi:hypothetical protein
VHPDADGVSGNPDVNRAKAGTGSVRRLQEGHSVRNTAKITGKGGSTAQRVKLAMKENSGIAPNLQKP